MCWLDHNRVRTGRTYRHKHARTFTPCLIHESPKPHWYPGCPRLRGALLSKHCALRDPLSRYDPLLLASFASSPSFPSHFVKAESHRSTEEEEEVEGGRGLLFYANTGCFSGVWIGHRGGKGQVTGLGA